MACGARSCVWRGQSRRLPSSRFALRFEFTPEDDPAFAEFKVMSGVSLCGPRNGPMALLSSVGSAVEAHKLCPPFGECHGVSPFASPPGSGVVGVTNRAILYGFFGRRLRT